MIPCGMFGAGAFAAWNLGDGVEWLLKLVLAWVTIAIAQAIPSDRFATLYVAVAA